MVEKITYQQAIDRAIELQEFVDSQRVTRVVDNDGIFRSILANDCPYMGRCRREFIGLEPFITKGLRKDIRNLASCDANGVGCEQYYLYYKGDETTA